MTGPDTIPSILSNRLNSITGDSSDWNWRSVGGGSINECYRLQCRDQFFFCKVNSAAKFPQLFDKEARGLGLLHSQKNIRTPTVIDCFESGQWQFLILEWIREGERTTPFWKKFGEQLARLHSINADTCGLDEDNYMGSVPQLNEHISSWSEFFSVQRLDPMIKKCREKQLLTAKDVKRFEDLEKKLDSIFDATPPSLLHGDLWSGNFMCDIEQAPVLIDPAVYYGHPSMDLAMTTLFSGFHRDFYEAYQYYKPFPSNYKEQWNVANLYPLLIHLYLFGSSYHPAIKRTLNDF